MYAHTEILKKIPLFTKLSPQELHEIASIATEEHHTHGSILLKEGTPGGELYVLLNGELAISKKDGEGNALELSRLKLAGDFVGEMSLFDHKTRSATVEVAKDSHVLKITRNDLFTKLSGSQNIFIKIIEEISLRFREFNDKYFHEILQKNEELKKLDTLKSNFITLTSHELKTPLNSILNASSLLSEFMKNKLCDNEKKCFSLIHTNVMRLNHAYNQIIEIAQMHNHTASFDRREQSDINEIIGCVVDEIEPYVETRHQKLQVSKCQSHLIPLNKEQMRQAILNIVQNAIKFTPDRGEIFIAPITKNGHLIITVRDTGIGIPSHELTNIFDSFYEVGDINTHKSGTYEFMSKGLGLGLSIAKKFIEINSGTINVDSKEKEGSTFTISFKL